MRVISIITASLLAGAAISQTPYDNIICADTSFTVRAAGIVIATNNLERAVQFYSGILGLEVENRDGKSVFLKSGDKRQIVIRETNQRIKPNSGSQDNISFSFQVNNIDSIYLVLKKKNVRFLEEKKRTEGVGYSLHIMDNDGNAFSLLQDTLSRQPPFSGVRLYNFGYYVSDMVGQAQLFCGVLGFVIRSKRYLPGDIPLGHRDKTFAFMLHLNRDEFKPTPFEGPAFPGFHLFFRTNDLDKARLALARNGFETKEDANSVFFTDKAGILAELAGN